MNIFFPRSVVCLFCLSKSRSYRHSLGQSGHICSQNSFANELREYFLKCCAKANCITCFTVLIMDLWQSPRASPCTRLSSDTYPPILCCREYLPQWPLSFHSFLSNTPPQKVFLTAQHESSMNDYQPYFITVSGLPWPLCWKQFQHWACSRFRKEQKSLIHVT